MAVKAQQDPSQNLVEEAINKVNDKIFAAARDHLLTAKERYVFAQETIDVLEKYHVPLGDQKQILATLKQRADKEALATDITGFMNDIGVNLPEHVNTGSPVTDDDYEKTIARKQEEMQKKMKERDTVSATPPPSLATPQTPLSLYEKCYRDIPLLTPEFLPPRDAVCKKQAAIGACQRERCETFRIKHEYVQNTTCIHTCSDDVEAGSYTTTSPVVKNDSKDASNDNGKNITDRLNFEIRALQRDIAELKINRVLLFSPKPATIMTKTTRATLAACLANLEKLRVSGLKGMAAKRDAALTAAKILSTSRARLDAKKKAEAAYAAATKGAAKQLTTAKAACQKAPGR